MRKVPSGWRIVMLPPDVSHAHAGGDVMDLSDLDLDEPSDVREVLVGIWMTVNDEYPP